MPRILSTLALLALFTVTGNEALAQYKNGQFGFEGGYEFLGQNTGLDSHGFLIGMRGGYKSTDRWWFTARGLVSFRGERDNVSQNTVVLFHLVPVDVRYYFETDSFRPFVGLTNSFQFLFNQTIDSSVFWGPGVTAGFEIKIRRDMFFGVQADAYWMFVFEGPDAPLITTTGQMIFFL